MSDLNYTNHARKQMIARDISWPTIEAVALSGEVIGEQANGVRKMHAFGIVVVLDHQLVVTVYRDSKQAPKSSRNAKPWRREEFKASWLRGRKVNVRLTNYYLGMVER